MVSDLIRVFPGSRDWQWVGSGGYAATYRGLSAQNKPVVGRVLTFESGSERAHRSATAQRLRLIQALDHARFWSIHSVFEDENLYWLSPWFDTRLDVSQGPLPRRAWPTLFADLCGALSAVHASALLHLNLHPGNVIAQSARFCLCDIHPLPDGVVRPRRVAHQQELVGAHPAYAAPEQIVGDATGPSTDIYSLACVFFEAITGRPCWTGASFTEVCIKKTREPAILSSTLPTTISQALERALSIDPSKRPATPEEFLHDLDATVVTPRSSSTRPRAEDPSDVMIKLLAPMNVGQGESVLIHFGADNGDGVLALARGSDPRAEPRALFSIIAKDGIDVDIRVAGGVTQNFRLNALRLKVRGELQHIVLPAPLRAGNAIVEVTVKQGQRIIADSKFVWFVNEGPATGHATASTSDPRAQKDGVANDGASSRAPESSAKKHGEPTLIIRAPGAPDNLKFDEPTTIATPTLPGYEITRALGQGGMASVYLATQKSLARNVAIKICRNAEMRDDGKFQRRFVQEAKLLARLTHSNICAIYDIVAQDDLAYYAMEYLPGGSLSDRMRDGMTMDGALDVLVSIASGLQHVHESGIVHRDLKPQNIMYRDDGTPVLLDFGISKQVSSNTQHTMEGMLVGTPNYMSPEQINAHEIDGRSDIYSLGVIAYEIFTGTLPFTGDTPIGVLMAHLTTPAPRISTAPTQIADIVDRMLCKNRDDRYASMKDIVTAFRSCSPRLAATEFRTEELQALPSQSHEAALRESKLSSTLFGRLAAFVRKSEEQE